MHKVQIPTSYGLDLDSRLDFAWEGPRGQDLFQHIDVKPLQTCRQTSSHHHRTPTSSDRKRRASTSGDIKRRRLVIFDKDGTLVCIHAMWTPWICGLVNRLEVATGLQLADIIYDKVSFDSNSSKIKSGLLGEGTMQQIHDTLTQILLQEGLPREKAINVMDECWTVRELDSYGDIKTVGDVAHLFAALKSEGYLVAVNTSDNRTVTETTLNHLNVRHLVDMVVCGDDPDIEPKPHPSTVQKICTRLQVEPKDTVMVGDSTSDMRLRQNAGIGCAIGVLTGIATRDVLESDADVVVDDIHQALPIILDHHHTHDTRCQ